MSSLRDLLTGVPQSPRWHPEGDVWAHTRLVRRSLEPAIQAYNASPLSQIMGPVTGEDTYLLRIAAWLHDAGKSSATAWTNPDDSKTPWTDFQKQGFNVRQMMSPGFGQPDGKWQALGHEDPEHYEPSVNKLGPKWQSILQSLPPEDQNILQFLVQQHMRFGDDGPHASVINQMFDAQGNVVKDRGTKLLFILKLMDNMGRDVDSGRAENLLQSVMSAIEYKRTQAERQAARRGPEDREGFIQWLRAKKLPEDQIATILRNKFGG